MDIQTFIHQANGLGYERKPFIFCLDYEMKQPLLLPLDEIENSEIKFSFHENNASTNLASEALSYETVDYETYKKAFDTVKAAIQAGNSYLLNLTFPTKIHSPINQETIYNAANAAYKFWVKDKFICYSPECFVKIKEDTIYSFPMKGTIDATIPNSSAIILNDAKELFEHNTIVDLIRNDLSIVAKHITVSNFRYIETIDTPNGPLLQVSSQVEGKLDSNWQHKIGEILYKLLPAGSISGAPKEKTLQIIVEAEIQSRDYYTGIFGIFDGNSVDSAVAIRMLQCIDDQWYYHSGGGITALSNCEEEFNEMKAKIYVPTYRKY